VGRIELSFTPRIAAVLILLFSPACSESRQSPTTPSPASPQQSVGTFAVEGRVLQVVPLEQDPIPGATVIVTSETGLRQIAKADSSGHYAVAGMTGSLEFEVSAAGFETYRQSWPTLRQNASVYFWLTPTLLSDQQRFEADCFSPCSEQGREDIYQVQARRSGNLIVEVRARTYDSGLMLELWRQSGPRVAQLAFNGKDPACTHGAPIPCFAQTSAVVVEGLTYELRVKAQYFLSYQITVKQPH